MVMSELSQCHQTSVPLSRRTELIYTYCQYVYPISMPISCFRTHLIEHHGIPGFDLRACKSSYQKPFVFRHNSAHRSSICVLAAHRVSNCRETNQNTKKPCGGKRQS